MSINNFHKLFICFLFCLINILIISCQTEQDNDREQNPSKNVEADVPANKVDLNKDQDQLINENLIDTAEVVKKIDALIDKIESNTDQLFRLEVDFVGYEEMVNIVSYSDSNGNLVYYHEEYGNTSGVGEFMLVFDQDEPVALYETEETPSGDKFSKIYSHRDFTPFSGFKNEWTENEGEMIKSVNYIGAKKLKEWGYQTLATVKRQKQKINGYINSPKGAELEGESMEFAFEKTDSTMPGMPVNITTTYRFDRWIFKDLFKK